jgi:uncharacterized protein
MIVVKARKNDDEEVNFISQLSQWINFAATGVEEVVQNVKYVLLTEYYSVPLDREFGMDFTMVDKPIPIARLMYSQEASMKIALYEPRAIFEEADYQEDQIQGKLGPTTVKIIIISTTSPEVTLGEIPSIEELRALWPYSTLT